MNLYRQKYDLVEKYFYLGFVLFILDKIYSFEIYSWIIDRLITFIYRLIHIFMLTTNYKYKYNNKYEFTN